VKVLGKHDVAAVVVELRVQNMAAVGRDGQSRPSAATADLEYPAHPSGREVEVVECQNIVHRKEVNTAWNNVPVRNVSGPVCNQ